MYKVTENQPYLNRAINYIASNMTEPPDLETVASIASFSKFHFHRMFKEFTGETLSDFTRRIRLEKAAFLLVFETHRTTTDIALTCGYMSSQSFNKAFKKYFGVTPKEYKGSATNREINFSNKDAVVPYNVTIKYLKPFTIVYNRNFGAYNNSQTHKFQQMSRQKYPDKEFIGVCWDNPDVTPEENCRYDTGYILKDDDKSTNTVMTEEIEEATYAFLETDIKDGDFESAWEYLLYSWLPRHGYAPARIFCFELVQEFPNESNNFVHRAQLYIPIKKL